VSHCGLGIYIKKSAYLMGKEELLKLKYFTMERENLCTQSQKNNNNKFNFFIKIKIQDYFFIFLFFFKNP